MKRFLKSIGYALQGLRFFFAGEKNGQIQSVVAIVVVSAGFICKISPTEWIAVLGCIALVLSLEMINSVIEKTMDLLHPEKHEKVQWIKDVGAAAVLWAAIVSSVIGCIIFLPKIFQ